jgi:hypothetical protein
MDELIGQLATKASIGSTVAEKTVGIMLSFLRSEGPSDKVQALIDKIPGAEAAIAASDVASSDVASSDIAISDIAISDIAISDNGGGLARLMGGGVMASGTRLMSLGLGVAEIQDVARELFRYGRDKIGADQIAEIVAGTPGLSQFA